jgi:hypothetical protein
LGNGDRVEREPPVEKVSQVCFLSGELDTHHDHKALDKNRHAQENTLELERDGETISSHQNEA